MIKTTQGEKIQPSKVTDYEVAAGEIISLQTGGGGGFGPPYERTLEMVQEDYEDGLVSEKQAEEEYGVIFDTEGQIDRQKTMELRKRQETDAL